MEHVLEIKSFSKGFFSKKVLKGINLNIIKGSIYGLIGPNGSGKSTLMKSIYGLSKGSGSITAMGRRGVDIRNIIAYMPTEDCFYPQMKVREIVRFHMDMYPDFNFLKAKDLLSALSLEEEEVVSSLSTGMKMRLKLALCLARDCSLYMLDEPLNGIDVISKKKITETIITYLTEDKTLIISSHMLSDIETILDRVIFIKDGEIALDDSLEKLREDENKSLEDLYWEVYND